MKILLAEDHALFREGMKSVLADLDGSIRIVEAVDYPEALALAETEEDFSLALVDMNMPGMEKFAGLAALSEKLGDVPIIVVSADQDEADIRRAVACGASGYIPKALKIGLVRDALVQVLAGETYLPAFAVDPDPAPRMPPRLTPRQRDVLGFIARGHSNKKIAAELDLAVGTVKLHVASLLKTLDVHNRTQAVFEATAQGLLPSPSR